MSKIALIIESAADDQIWGRVSYDDNLIVANANSIEKLENEMANQLVAFHNLKKSQIEFEIQHDLSGLFDHKSYLSISSVAKLAGISSSLMRQYASGVKNPSTDRLKVIQKAIHEIGRDLQTIKLAHAL
jgi:hypothetical protein